MPSTVTRHSILLTILALIGAIVTSAAFPGDLDITQGWSRATPPGVDVGVVYLAIENHGAADRLIGVASPVAKHTELHISEMRNGVMSMRHLEDVKIPADASTRFGPGGRHIMLIGLKHPLRDGDAFPLTLTFANAGPMRVTVKVLGIGQTPDSKH